MAITTRGGKQMIDPPMSSNEKKVTKHNDKVVEVNGYVEDNTGKDVEGRFFIVQQKFHLPLFQIN